MRFCTKCGKEYNDGKTRFCTDCGGEVKELSFEPSTNATVPINDVCRKCGKPFPPDKAFCTSCGAQREVNNCAPANTLKHTAAATRNKGRAGLVAVLVLCCVVLSGACVGGFYVLNNFKSSDSASNEPEETRKPKENKETETPEPPNPKETEEAVETTPEILTESVTAIIPLGRKNGAKK